MPIATSTPHPHLPPAELGRLSPWQETVRSHPLLNKGKDDALPQSAEVVVIGSGMCGAVVANALLKAANRPQSVVCLEAREICSGASGRNAGHCRPDPHRGFVSFAQLHGEEQAKKICESESDVLKRVDMYIKEHGVSCEWTSRRTHDSCMTEEFANFSQNALDEIRTAGGRPAVEVKTGKDAALETRVDHVLKSFSWDAATLNPAQLTLSVHTENVSLGGYDLFAWTPVQRVVKGKDKAWSVETKRGAIETDKVVFATNAYSQALIPELKDLIVPMRAQALKLSAAPAGPKSFPRLEASYSMRFLLQHFYSVAVRPDNSLVLGTSRGWKGMPAEVYQSILNNVDDSQGHDVISANALEAIGNLFPQSGWGGPEKGGFEYSWAGIIGMTPDAVPFIGDVPDKDGQYVAAGYNGHGMARIFLCAPTLAEYILTSQWDPAMPEAFRITPERLAKLRAKVEAPTSERPASHVAGKEGGTVNGTLVPALKDATI